MKTRECETSSTSERNEAADEKLSTKLSPREERMTDVDNDSKARLVIWNDSYVHPTLHISRDRTWA